MSNQRFKQIRMGDPPYSGLFGRRGPLTRDSAPADTESSAGAVSAPAPTPYLGEELAAELLGKVFARLPGSIPVRLWSGPAFKVGAEADEAASGRSEPRFTLVFRNPQAVCTLILGRDPLRIVEAYFRDDLDIEGDLFAALSLKDHLESIQVPLRDRLSALLMARKLRSLNRKAAEAAADSAPTRSLTVRFHSR